MSKAREEAQWRSGKSEIIGKYRQDHEKLFSVVASRGFTKLPGFAADTETRLELAAKLNLSELNLKIITETVEREIKQAGLDYDISYRAAAVAWEIDKHNLMAAWQQEYGTIQTNMANDEEVLDRLMIEVRGRGSYLIEQKTAIELQAEALKQELAGLDGSTATYEVTLANAKMLTAQKKLEIIPIFQQILAKEESLLELEKTKAREYANLIAASDKTVIFEKEQALITLMQRRDQAYSNYVQASDKAEVTAKQLELLTKEGGKAAAIAVLNEATDKTDIISKEGELLVKEGEKNDAEAVLIAAQDKSAILAKQQELLIAENEKIEAHQYYIDAEKELADKKQTALVPAMGALLNASERYAGELPGQIALEKQIGAEKVSQAGIATESAVLRTEIAQISTDISEEDLEQAELKRDLQKERNETEETIGRDVLENVTDLTEEESSINADILADEAATNAYLLSKKRTTDSERNRGELVSSNTITAAEASKMDNIAASDASAVLRNAEIEKAKTISADLQHLIG